MQNQQPVFDDNISSYKTIKTKSDVNCVKYTENKKSLASGCFDGCVTLYNVKNTVQEIVLQDKDTKAVDNVVTGITFEEKKGTQLTCSYAGGLIKQWVIESGFCTFTIKEKRQTMGVCFHPKHSKLFSFGDDGKILLYDVETQKNELIYQSSESSKLDGHTTKIFCMCFNPVQPNEFISGGWDNVTYFWDVRISSAVRSISDIFIGGDGLAINKRGTELVTSEWKRENPMKLWDYKTGKLIDTINPDSQNSQLYCAKFANENTCITGGCDVNMLRLVNMKTYTTLSFVKALPTAVFSVDSMSTAKKGQFINKFDELADLPNVAFCSGRNIYELRYK